jgi:hypothetical protein
MNWESKMDHLCVFLVQTGETNCARSVNLTEQKNLLHELKARIVPIQIMLTWVMIGGINRVQALGRPLSPFEAR